MSCIIDETIEKLKSLTMDPAMAESIVKELQDLKIRAQKETIVEIKDYWGKNPTESQEKYSMLSNLKAGPITYNKVWYQTVEHAFQAEKAKFALANTDSNNPNYNKVKEIARVFSNTINRNGKYITSDGKIHDSKGEKLVNGGTENAIPLNSGKGALTLGRSIPGGQWLKEWDKISDAKLEEVMRSYYDSNTGAKNLLMSTGYRTIKHPVANEMNKNRFEKILTDIREDYRNNTAGSKSTDGKLKVIPSKGDMAFGPVTAKVEELLNTYKDTSVYTSNNTRQALWFGPVNYEYFGASHAAEQMPELVKKLAKRAESIAGRKDGYFNSVLINKYTEDKGLVYHSDGEPIFRDSNKEVGEILTMTLKGSGTISIKNNKTGVEEVIDINPGDVYIMPSGKFQDENKHKVETKGERISLTFRHVPDKQTPVKTNSERNTPEFNKLPFKNTGKKTWTYAGIGSRETPLEIQKEMNDIAKHLDNLGYTLHSGGALGADKAFEGAAQPWFKNDGTEVGSKEFTKSKADVRGWSSYKNKPVNKRIFKTSDATDQTRAIAKELHPAPDMLNDVGLNLMARNTYQVFGENLDEPVDFVLFYAEETKDPMRPKGGTGQAVEMARRKGIPTINMWNNPNWESQLMDVIADKKDPLPYSKENLDKIAEELDKPCKGPK